MTSDKHLFQHKSIAIVTPAMPNVATSPYFGGLIAGVMEGLRQYPFQLHWLMIPEKDFAKVTLGDLFQKSKVDGLIFLAWRFMPKVAKEVHAKKNLPVVLINDYDRKIKADIVHSPNESGVLKVCQFLRSKGYKKIGMLRGPEKESLDAKERWMAFQKGAKKAGYALRKEDVFECPHFEEEVAYKSMSRWMDTGDFPEAIFCANDDLARGAMKAIFHEKLRIPEHVGIVGYDDSMLNDYLNPALTSVRQPLSQMGQKAVEILARHFLKAVKKPVQIKFDPELIIRQSA